MFSKTLSTYRKSEMCFFMEGSPTSSLLVDLQHLAPVSRYSLNAHTHHSAQVSLCVSFYHSWELVAGFWTLSRACFMCSLKFEFESNSRFPGTFETPEIKEDVCLSFSEFLETCGLGFAIAGSSPVFFSLSSLRHGVRLFQLNEKAAGDHREIHDVELRHV